MHWRLYAKWPKQKQFKPVDYKEGKQVTNLIYATIFSTEEKDKVENDLQQFKTANEGMTWKWKIVGGY